MNQKINLVNVSKRLGNRDVLNKVSFDVQQGDIFGYLGPNGAGKTTTIRILLGLFSPSSGEVSILGRKPSAAVNRQNIGFILESDGLYNSMTGYQNIQLYNDIYGIPRANGRVEKVLKMTGMKERAGDKVSTYSKGMRQRLALARAMVHDPEVLILDEPTSGVDPTGQIEVRQVLLDITNRGGKTVFLSSHNLDEVQRICNRIALIDRGEIKLFGERDKLLRERGGGEVKIETSNHISDEIAAELIKIPEVVITAREEQALTLAIGKTVDVADVVDLLTRRGARIQQVTRHQASLEELYTAIMREAEGNA